MKTLGLKLFLVGQGAFGQEARDNLEALAKKFPEYEFDLEVIDVLENPERAVEDRVIATPTLIKYTPMPVCRIVGDLSDRQRVISALGLRAMEADGAKKPENLQR